MAAPSSLATQVELSFVASDLQFFGRLAQPGHHEDLQGVGFLALMPFLSAVVVETASYIQSRGTPLQVPRQHEALLRASRLRLKLLDDDQRTFEAILGEADQLASAASGFMTSMHRGLGIWKRLLQPDLGLYLIDGHLVCSTHVAILNLGLRPRPMSQVVAAGGSTIGSLGQYMQTVALSVGEFIGFVSSAMGLDLIRVTSSEPSSPFEFRDAFSGRFYRAVAQRVAPRDRAASLLVTMLASEINVGRVLVPLASVLVDTPLAAFKIRFLSCYHVASSLQKLLDKDYRLPFLLGDIATELRSLLQTSEVRLLRRLTGLRNTLVHYSVDIDTGALLQPDMPLNGLCEAYGRPFRQVDESVMIVEKRISDMFANLLAEGLTKSTPAPR
jgi:hypothetical protein